MTTTKPTWVRVSTKQHCPICDKPDWCTITADGQVACCMRVQSDRPAKNGGWIHRPDGHRTWTPPLVPRQRHGPPPSDFGAMMARWAEATTVEQLCDLAEALGVWYRALARLGAAWAPPHNAWAFPMRDGADHVIGVRLRAMDGRKWAVYGSRAGLIYDPTMTDKGPLLICEGPTDTAAAMTAGYAAVGRPSCRGQDDLLRALLARSKADIVIVADNDPPHERPDGDAWRPGLDGARDLATALRKPCRILVPPVKDLREWVRDQGDIAGAIGNAAWLNVR